MQKNKNIFRRVKGEVKYCSVNARKKIVLQQRASKCGSDMKNMKK